jgi:hypothetical protein
MKLWKDVDLERERRGFIEARKNHVSMLWLVLLVAVVCSGAYFCQNKYPSAVNIAGVWKQWKAEK